MHRKSGTATLTQADAVEEALCYGWIDSKSVRRDDASRFQRFTPRRPQSNWSKLNRQRVQRLVEQGLMTPYGQAVVDHARRMGTWDALTTAEDLVVPDDLHDQLATEDTALRNFTAFPPSARRHILTWIASAKRPETRSRRIARTVELAARNIRAADPRA